MVAITVNSRKFDGSISRSWRAELVQFREPLVTVVGRFEKDVEHDDLGKIVSGTYSYEYFWTDRWFSVFRFHEPDHTLRCHYININMPVGFDGKVIDYVDLDVDLVVWPAGDVSVLDLSEFEDNSVRFGYTSQIRERVRQVTKVLTEQISKPSDLEKLLAARWFPGS